MPTKTTSTKSYEEFRAGFALQGSSIRKWASARGINVSFAYDALKGARRGPAAERVRAAAERYLSAAA